MPDANALVTRTLADEAELRRMVKLVWRSFLSDGRADGEERELALLDPDRTHAVFDGNTMIGGGTVLERSMTLPGARVVPVAAVSAVGVAPNHQGRGALTTLMRAQLHGLHDGGGEPIAALWASEAGIYGRFGYGLASRRATITVPKGIALRRDVQAGERVELPDADTVQSTLRKLHGEYTAGRIGAVSRPQAGWDWHLADDDHDRGGATAYRYAVVSGGYAVFRVKEDWESSRYGPRHRVSVRELVSLTPSAHATLWRFLAGQGLVGEVCYGNAPLDDPLPFMLENPRMAATDVGDALFVRLVDLDRALPQRGYAAPLDIVIEVTDDFCPWNAGRWRLTVDDAGTALVRRTGDDADLACGAVDLGAAFLGSTRWRMLAAAGRVHELRPGALRAADAAFAAEHEPHCLEAF